MKNKIKKKKKKKVCLRNPGTCHSCVKLHNTALCNRLILKLLCVCVCGGGWVCGVCVYVYVSENY